MAINHKHLFYFWKTAREGGVVKAGEALHVTPQTISGQIRLLEESLGVELFGRHGRSLELTETGRLVLEYAEEMFSLSAELEQIVRHYPAGRPTEFRVGVSDALPKSLVYQLLQPAVLQSDPVRIICREWRLERLLAALLEHRLDLVIADTPLTASGPEERVYSHHLGESGLSFLASRKLLDGELPPFPAGLGRLPLLLPGEDAALRQKLTGWLERQRLRPKVVGEFDDFALMVAFGQAGVGVFAVPTAIEAECLSNSGMVLLGRAAGIRSDYYAISMERRLTHPCVLSITEAARQRLGGPDKGNTG
ncbi:transcriptional activator NhaR [Azovibrio restrictus]|uniref:transcriptional activator NhaR n=1 Tax=Azovibrio restrictus TaxID=146938 RepID=UPI0026EC5259|nr:transcriptional activator NhaR [Azovibrio restrictus]